MNLNILILIIFLLLPDPNKNELYNQNKLDTSQLLFDKIKPDTSLVDSLNNLCFELRGSDPAQAIFIGKRALEYARALNYSKGYLMSHSFIGVSYRNISDFTTAMNYYTKAFFLADSLGDIEQKAYAYNNIGNLLYQQEKDSLALKNILGALRLGEEINDKRIIAYSHINLGRIYTNLKQWNEAIKYFILSVNRRKELNDYWGVSNTLIEVAEVYLKSRRFNLAIKTFNDAMRIADTLANAQRLKADIYNGYGKTYLAKGNYQDARHNFLGALRLAHEIDDKRMIMENYNSLAEIAQSLSNYRTALEYKEKYIEYKDSVYNIETDNHISRLEIQFQTREMDKENQLLRQNNSIQDLQLSKNRTIVNFLIIISILLVILGGFVYSRLKSKQKATILLRNKNTEIEKQKVELAELNATKDKFFSIIAHDLRNPFGSLIGNTEYLIQELEQVSLEENKEILKAIRNSSKSGYDLLENLLTWAKTQRGTIEFQPEVFDLKELIESNIDLHKNTAVLKKIELKSELENSIQLYADKKMINTILNNLINNSLKFTGKYGEVSVSALLSESSTKIFVKDTGVGIPHNLIAKIFKLDQKAEAVGTEGETGTGLGLIICKEFIDTHNGEISIESELGKGTTIFVELPVKKIE